jgi:DNA (cytosine-5)-methyltransferase 1
MSKTSGDGLATQIKTDIHNGKLNPDWVEWLMGIPFGWTSLKSLNREDFEEWLDKMQLGEWWLVEPAIPRITTTKTSRMDRLKALGNGIVPAVVAEFLRRTIK